MKLKFLIVIAQVLADNKGTLKRTNTYPFIASITHILQKPCSGVLYQRNTVVTIKYCAQHLADEYVVTLYRDNENLDSNFGMDLFKVNEIISEESNNHRFSSRPGLSIMRLNSTDSRSTGIILDILGIDTSKDRKVRLISWSRRKTFLPPFKSLKVSVVPESQDLSSITNFQFSYGSQSSHLLACKYNPGSLLIYYSEGEKPTLAGIRSELPCESNNGMPTYIGVAPRRLWIRVVSTI